MSDAAGGDRDSPESQDDPGPDTRESATSATADPTELPGYVKVLLAIVIFVIVAIIVVDLFVILGGT